MKRLILIENDYSGAGKTALSRCLHHYLEVYQVPHHSVVLTESPNEFSTHSQIDVDALQVPVLLDHLRQSDLVIAEIETGLAQCFHKFYEENNLLETVLAEGFDLTVLVPVTWERESFDGVVEAAEVFSDGAQYLVVHTPSSAFYDEDKSVWERSRAARTMDMLEAVDMDMPTTLESLDDSLMARHMDLTTALGEAHMDPELQEQINRWFRRVEIQLDGVRKYVFGDAFRPSIIPSRPAPAKRKTRTKASKELAVFE